MKKLIALILIVVLAIGSYMAWSYYKKIFNANTAFTEDYFELLIPSNSTYQDLLYNLEADHVLKDLNSFVQTAELKKFNKVKSGRYLIQKGLNNQEIINKLRIGDQDPVNVTFNNVRLKSDLAGKISKYLEIDSLSLLESLKGSDYSKKYGFNSETFVTMFIPDTYQMNWNISMDELIERFATEYKRFWTEERKAKAKQLNLSQSEVAILASIVKAETIKADEAPKVAGLYINRLRKKMALQSDPTLIFALQDFEIRRVLNKHKEIESPYNTYKYGGLPPGPINLPSKVYLNAVLNYENHDYIFMCAKSDFSGYHNFAKTNRQHEIYAAEYRRALDKRGIYN